MSSCHIVNFGLVGLSDLGSMFCKQSAYLNWSEKDVIVCVVSGVLLPAHRSHRE